MQKSKKAKSKIKKYIPIKRDLKKTATKFLYNYLKKNICPFIKNVLLVDSNLTLPYGVNEQIRCEQNENGVEVNNGTTLI